MVHLAQKDYDAVVSLLRGLWNKACPICLTLKENNGGKKLQKIAE